MRNTPEFAFSLTLPVPWRRQETRRTSKDEPYAGLEHVSDTSLFQKHLKAPSTSTGSFCHSTASRNTPAVKSRGNTRC